MRWTNVTWCGVLAASLVACGGAGSGKGDNLMESPCPECGDGDGDTGGGGVDDTLVPEEKYEEIKATFERKIGTVKRCYVEGFEAGEVERTEKGHVTVGLTINENGRPSDVRVLETSFSSKTIGECVVRMVSGWEFTTLPKPLDTSHTYVLDRL
jgi:hypothetical protein